MYRVLVCDDEIDMLNTVVASLNNYADLYDMEVIGFSCGRELYAYCTDNDFDIVYMDIEIGSDNGLELAKSLKLINPDVLIIYISFFCSYYVPMVQAEPFRFILKEAVDTAKFEKAIVNVLEPAINRLQRKKLWSFVFKREQYVVDLKKIKYFYSFGRKINIVGDIGEVPEYFYGKLDNLENELKVENPLFIRVNSRYIVNMLYIRVVGKYKISILDKTLTIPLVYQEDFHLRYIEFEKKYL